MSWTEERVETLKKLWSEGLSASQIATTLGGVSRNAVIGKVHRLKLPGRVKPATSSEVEKENANVRTVRVALEEKPAVDTSKEDIFLKAGTVALEEVVEAKVDFAEEVAESLTETFAEATNSDQSQPRRLTLLQLTENTCKWPVGDPLASDFYFCGERSEDSSPYCSAHSKVAYQNVSERRRRVN